jgi:hypothetical protein
MTCNPLHSEQTVNDGIHIPYSFEYSNSTERNTAVLTSEDIGKFSRQIDENSVWMLTGIEPTWKQISGPEEGVPVSRCIDTAYGLTGGGDLTHNITISPVYGSDGYTVCAGNDERLSDARSPINHSSEHIFSGNDAVPQGIATGLIYGCFLTINSTDPATFDITDGFGVIVDYHTDHENPELKFITVSEQIGVSDPLIAVCTDTYISVGLDGNFVFAQETPGAIERRDLIHIGWLSHPDYSEIYEAVTEPFASINTGTQLDDLSLAIGAFNVYGNAYGPYDSDLRISRSAGRTYSVGSNFRNDCRKPHYLDTEGENPVQDLWYFYRDPMLLDGWNNSLGQVFNIDPNNYDDGTGTLVEVPDYKFTVQIITWYAQWESTDIQYGQEIFDTLDDALGGLQNAVLNPWNASDTLRGWLVVKKGTTDLSDPTKARFIEASKFTGVMGGGGSSGGEANTASNVGAAGVGVFKGKVGVNFEFKTINAGSSKIIVSNDTDNNEVDIDVDLSEIAHQDIGGAGTLTHANIDAMEEAIRPVLGSGVVTGGVITPTGGIGFSVAAGTGISVGKNPLALVTWDELTGSTLYGGSNYISITPAGALAITYDFPPLENIKLGYLFTDGTNSYLYGISLLQNSAATFIGAVHELVREALGALVRDGLGISEQASPNYLKISMGAGTYYAQLNKIEVSSLATFVKMTSASNAGWVIDGYDENYVNTTQWNDVTQPSGAQLITMTDTYWKKDLFCVMPFGGLYYMYSQAEYATEDDAKAAPIPAIPDPIARGGACFLATVVSRKGDITIANRIIDIRPLLSRVFGFGVTAGGAAIDHGSLSGLGDDDHAQYYNETRLTTWLGGLTTTNLTEGTNLYYTTTRVNSWLSGKSTSDLAEGTNLYYTDVRVAANSAVAAATSHVASTSNPHSTTASQVGLGSVTNDAQLKRAAADFSSFSEKSSPVSGDLLLIEDSADAGAKKRLQIANLPAGIDTTALHKATAAEISALTEKTTPVSADVLVIEDSAASYAKKRLTIGNLTNSSNVFGQNFQSASSSGRSTTSSTTFQSKVTLTTPALTGTFRIGWNALLDHSSTSSSCEARLYNTTDAVGVGTTQRREPKDTLDIVNVCSVSEVTLAGVAKTFAIQYRSQSANTTGIQDARVEFWRVA